jgi:hypothetical protein
MNPQQMLKQVQKMQRDMENMQNEINNTEFTSKSNLVEVVMTGDRKLKSVKIDSDSLDKDDVEMVEDMLIVAINDVLKQITDVTEEKMGAISKNMPKIPGLF